VPARVPDSLLGNGSGWAADAGHSDAQPQSQSLGLVQRQTLAYTDDGKHGNGGYPANLALTTLKLFPTPSRDQLRDIVQQQVKEQSQAQGIQLGNQALQGSRTLADGHTTLFFVFTGTVTGQGSLFTSSNATAKILGEVWNCGEAGTSVVAVGLAQVGSASSLGGIPLQNQENPQNWRELAADPHGSIDNQQGGDGLVDNAVCAPGR
jgi:hypothetical protein